MDINLCKATRDPPKAVGTMTSEVTEHEPYTREIRDQEIQVKFRKQICSGI